MASDNLPPIWKAEPHTLAKHKILQNYWQAWTAIFAHQQSKGYQKKGKLLYIDGFAGPGTYEGNQKGSPILALETVLEHNKPLPAPIDFIFIENEKERVDSLQELVDQLKRNNEDTPQFKRIGDIKVIHGDSTENINFEIDRRVKELGAFGPALVFLDQFGYSNVPMTLVKRIMSFTSCEVLTYLEWNLMNAYMQDTNKRAPIDKAFGRSSWQKVFALPNQNRHSFICEHYKESLRIIANVKFVWHFNMLNKYDKPTHWLFFCTNHLKGFKQMKTAMWKVGREGGFCFSDKDDPNQFKMLNDFTDEMIAKQLLSKFAGKIKTAKEIEEFTLTDTPAYNFKPILRFIEKSTDNVIIQRPQGRKNFSFPDDILNSIIIHFPKTD